jgi:Tfp pilus assembly protein PilN
MKRMNLLPPDLRAREGGRRGSSYIVIGALAAAVVAMLSYGVIISGVRSDESELASLKRDTAEAQARADALSPYGAFADMKERRERSVRNVADARFDYERLTRELARVLPAGVWVSHLDVAPAAPAEDVVAAGADSVDGSRLQPPAMTVSGCAPSQDVVADTLDRLRALTGATNVALGSSSQSGAEASSSGDRPQLVSGAGSGSGGCGEGGRPRVGFDATVTLTAPVGVQIAAPPAPPTGAGS